MVELLIWMTTICFSWVPTILALWDYSNHVTYGSHLNMDPSTEWSGLEETLSIT